MEALILRTVVITAEIAVDIDSGQDMEGLEAIVHGPVDVEISNGQGQFLTYQSCKNIEVKNIREI